MTTTKANKKEVWTARKKQFEIEGKIIFQYAEMMIEFEELDDGMVKLVADGFECAKVEDFNEAKATVLEW